MGAKISEDLEDVDITEVEKEYLKGKTRPADIKGMIVLSIELIVVGCLMLIPALLIWLCHDFPDYNIFTAKATVGTDPRMEFIRWSVYFSALYSTYLVLLISLQILPSVLLWFIETLSGKISYTARRRLHHARSIDNWIALAAFFVVLAWVSAYLLYDTSFLSAVTATVSGREMGNAGLLIMERLYVLIVFLAIFIASGRYLLSVIAYNFLQTAFAKRIHICNYKFTVLQRMFSALSRGIPSTTRKSGHGRSSQVSLIPDTGMDLSSGKRSEEIADLMFEKLCPSNRDSIREEDFRPYFDADEIPKAFSVFDVQDTSTIDQSEFRESIFQIHEERHNIAGSLHCHNHIIRRLGVVFDSLSLVLTILMGVALFKLQATAVVAVFGTVYLGLNFAVQTGLRGAYDALHFIFVEHAYDVGDRIILNGESLLVERIEIFTTVFRRTDGTAAYVSSSTLAGAKIYNIRRSGHSSDLFTVELDTSIATEKIWLLRDALEEFTKGHPREFTGLVDVSSMDLVDSKVKVEFLVEFRGNFQSISRLTMRKNMINAAIDNISIHLKAK